MLKRLRAWWKRQTGADIQEANERYAAECRAFRELIEAEQYIPWLGCMPPQDTFVMVRSMGMKPEIIKPSDLHPYVNLAGLYWRPLGSVTIEGVASPAAEDSRLIH